MKVAINTKYGGFGLSSIAEDMYKKLKNIEDYEDVCDWDIERHDPILIKVIEELGDQANANYAKLKIVEIPDNVKYEIIDYDGKETIHEIHRSWS